MGIVILEATVIFRSVVKVNELINANLTINIRQYFSAAAINGL